MAKSMLKPFEDVRVTDGKGREQSVSDHIGEAKKDGEKPKLQSQDVTESRNASAEDIQRVEDRRTDRSDGSLAKFSDLPRAVDRPNAESLQIIAFKDGEKIEIDKSKNVKERQLDSVQKPEQAPVAYEIHSTGAQAAPSEQIKTPAPTPILQQAPKFDPPPPVLPEKFVPQPNAPVFHKFEAPPPIPPGRIESLHSTEAVEKPPEAASELSLQRLEAAKKRLTINAERMITNEEELKLFKKDIEIFETDYLKRTAKEPDFAVSEIAATMDNLSRILEKESALFPDAQLKKLQNSPEDTSFRVRLAEEVLRHSADPSTVDQGKRPVCQVESLQFREYWRDPSKVSAMVADVFQTGTCPGKSGPLDLTALSNPRGNTLLPDREAKDYPAYKGNDSALRGYASKLFDVAAVNIGLQIARPGATYTESDDKVFITEGGRRVEITGTDLPYITSEHLGDINQRIIGVREAAFVVEGWPLDENGNEFPVQLNPAIAMSETHSTCIGIRSGKDLPDKLLWIQKSGQWPPIMHCKSSLQPILAEWQRAFPRQPVGTGTHFLNLPILKDDAKYCSVDNTWSKKSDDPLPVIPVEQIGANAATVRANQDKTYRVAVQQLENWIDGPSFKACKKQWFEELPKLATSNPGDALDKWVKAHPTDTYAKLWYEYHPQDKDGALFVEWMKAFCDKYHK